MSMSFQSVEVKRPDPEIFDVVRKICPKEDIAQVGRPGKTLGVHHVETLF